jgi:hypothetical protein
MKLDDMQAKYGCTPQLPRRQAILNHGPVDVSLSTNWKCLQALVAKIQAESREAPRLLAALEGLQRLREYSGPGTQFSSYSVLSGQLR